MEIVTIDGPTSSGKNSVGFLLSQKLGYQYIDTGMIYRVGTYLVLKNNIALDNVEIRARRRYEQLHKVNPSIEEKQVLQDMKKRDEQDSTREISPLRIPEGATVIDNSKLSVEQTVDEMLKNIHV